MLLESVFLPTFSLLVNNNSPNYRYKSGGIWIHSWKWCKCLINYVPEMENVIRFNTLPTGFFWICWQNRRPSGCGNTLFIRVINLKGGKTLRLVIIIVPRDLSNQWGIKILFSYTSSYGSLQHALLINSRPLIILFFKGSFMKTWLSFAVWICRLCDSDSSHRSLKNRNWKQLNTVLYFSKK